MLTLWEVQETEITDSELTRLAECEAVIERGLKTFVDVGNALLEIRDSRLYRAEFGTFEDYCKERWGMKRAHAYRMIEAAQVVETLSPMGDILPTSERQARPLTVLEPEQQREAWQYVVNNAPPTGITAAQVLEAAKIIQAEKREAKRAERVEIITREVEPLDNLGPFNVIYADPPWRYDYSVSTSREIENQYPTMSLEEICALQVAQVSTDDSVLLMWATSPKLADAMRVLDAWGFTYKTSMVWVKDKIGMGYYARQQHEILLIATRGNLPTPEPANRPSSVIYGDRTEHSSKPEEFYEVIERMYPEFSRVELFCRTPRNGWYTWGNQA
ncbi:MAG: MT-A70 family methyltransferase [Candidatus Paceibacterota bacterium]|jgi:N6-adenosine-specific RNA methylase IME4